MKPNLTSRAPGRPASLHVIFFLSIFLSLFIVSLPAASAYYPSSPNTAAINITGRVTDDTGNPLPGVNITVRGTEKGVITGLDGRYTLTQIDENAVLVVSYVGYQTQEIAVSGRSQIDITLLTTAQTMELYTARALRTV